MGICFYRGTSDKADCRYVSTDMVYQDQTGHSFCVLHAPKYYIQPRGFFYGNVEDFGSGSKQVRKEEFEGALKKLIENQRPTDKVQLNNIYFPRNFTSSLDRQFLEEKIFYFNRCQNLPSISNSHFKALRIINCSSSFINIYKCTTEEISISGSGPIMGASIGNCTVGTISINFAEFSSPVKIEKINEIGKEVNYACSLYINRATFRQNVEISNVNFRRSTSDVRFVDSNFEQNLYYNNSSNGGKIDFDHCRFRFGKAYLENVNVESLLLSRLNLEYLRFSNCSFPDRYKNIEDSSLTHAEEVYRDLKKIADEQKDYSLVSRWHFLEKEMSKSLHKKNKERFIWVFLVLYRALSGYGEKPGIAMLGLLAYVLFTIIVLTTVSIAHTGFGDSIDWEIVHRAFYSFRDFVPLFVTPSTDSLHPKLTDSSNLKLLYNFLAALGRMFCLVQVALLSMAIRNHLKR